MTSPLVPPAGRRVPLQGLLWVTLGSSMANVAGYLLHLPASRWLGPEQYGVLASLLATQLLAAVPALALQVVIARQVVRGGTRSAARALALRTAAVVAVAALVALAPVALLLAVPWPAAAAALLSAPLLVLVAGEQGVLQGHSDFRRLGVVLALVGLLRVGPAVLAVAVVGTATAGLVAGALGATSALLVVRRFSAPDHAAPSGARAGPAALAGVLRASQVQLVLILLTSVDLLVARGVLDSADAGRYALGAVAAKGAFWLPQAVGVVLYPRMADPAQHGRALRTAVLTLVAIGAVVVVGAVVAAPLVPVVIGPAYAEVSGLLWVFALQGAALTVVQSVLLAAVAGDRAGVAGWAWAGLAVQLSMLAALGDQLVAVLVVSVLTALALAAALTVRELASSRTARAAG